MGITSSNQGGIQTPEITVDRFIAATIEGDANRMGELIGLNPARGKPLDQALGTILGPEIEQYWRGQAQNPADYRWETKEQGRSEQSANVEVELFRPDYGAIAHRTSELLGFTTDQAGMLTAPDEPTMDAEKAERLAREDPQIEPLHYRLALHVINQNDRWILDPEDPATSALVAVIRRGDLLETNEEYLIR